MTNDGDQEDEAPRRGPRNAESGVPVVAASDPAAAAASFAPPHAPAERTDDAAHGTPPAPPPPLEAGPAAGENPPVGTDSDQNEQESSLGGAARSPVGTGSGRPGGIAGEPHIEPRLAGMRGIWSDRTLHERLVGELLVRDDAGQSAFRWGRIDPAGYRLAMGPEVYVSPAKASDKGSVRILKEREAVLIPSGQFAFLCTEEIVRVPDDAFCFITLRSKRTKFRGLVNVSGFHADPGYNGRLVFAVFNAGPGDVHLRRGDELFAIMFADLDRPARTPRPVSEAFTGIPSDLIAPIAGELQSLAGLKENLDEVQRELDQRVRAMEREVAILRWAVALILGAFVTLLVRGLLGR